MNNASSYRLWSSIGALAFNRITVVRKELLPASGPVMFVATHRNGALDAAAYAAAARSATPMVSAQLHRSALGRMLFPGIAVARAKDKARGIEADNSAAVKQCVEHLRMGGRLFIMPEGTSSLGPEHLPFHRGAARILKAAIEAGVKPTIVPLGVHYEDPTRWQSRAEVLVGRPVVAGAADEETLHDAITQGLEDVGAYFIDAEMQCLAERLAYACTLGTDASYAMTLKSLQRDIPVELLQTVSELEHLARSQRLMLHQGVPLMPTSMVSLYVLFWLLLLPFVLGFAVANAPVVAAAHIASRKLPDAPNVMAFWRMTVGLPVGLVWFVLFSGILFAMSESAIVVALYWIVTIAGIKSWYRFRKLSIALFNGLFRSREKAALMRCYNELLAWREHDRIV